MVEETQKGKINTQSFVEALLSMPAKEENSDHIANNFFAIMNARTVGDVLKLNLSIEEMVEVIENAYRYVGRTEENIYLCDDISKFVESASTLKKKKVVF